MLEDMVVHPQDDFLVQWVVVDMHGGQADLLERLGDIRPEGAKPGEGCEEDEADVDEGGEVVVESVVGERREGRRNGHGR